MYLRSSWPFPVCQISRQAILSTMFKVKLAPPDPLDPTFANFLGVSGIDYEDVGSPRGACWSPRGTCRASRGTCRKPRGTCWSPRGDLKDPKTSTDMAINQPKVIFINRK